MTPKEESIIQIIQEMIKDGQSEQAILANLRELGVPMEKAKKLLLVGQADIYPVIQSEISRLVDKKLQEKKPEIVHNIQSEMQLAEEQAVQNVKEKTLQELKEYEKYLENKLMIMESQVNANVGKALQTSDSVRNKLLADEARIERFETGESGEERTSVHTRANSIMAGLGILFAIATAFIFYSAVSGGISTESLIIGVVLGLISVTILFVSTLL